MKRNLHSLYICLLACLAATPLHAGTITGIAQVIDGDSLSVSGIVVRLSGIDAPEYTQPCTLEGQQWDCGKSAAGHLRTLVGDQIVMCRSTGIDQFSRTLAICDAGGKDLNLSMVEAGWAIAFRQQSSAYVPAEERAKASRLGIWTSIFVPPQQYRDAQLVGAVTTRTPAHRRATQPVFDSRIQGCTIKGNRSIRGEWIYHLPGMPYYAQTRAEELFCSEAEAQAAGYRRAFVRP